MWYNDFQSHGFVSVKIHDFGTYSDRSFLDTLWQDRGEVRANKSNSGVLYGTIYVNGNQ